MAKQGRGGGAPNLTRGLHFLRQRQPFLLGVRQRPFDIRALRRELAGFAGIPGVGRRVGEHRLTLGENPARSVQLGAAANPTPAQKAALAAWTGQAAPVRRLRTRR